MGRLIMGESSGFRNGSPIGDEEQMAAYYQDLCGRTRGALILVEGQLQAKTIEIVEELIDHNEPGVAIEIMSNMLVEDEAQISSEVFTAVGRLVADMKLEPSYAEQLEPLVHDDSEPPTSSAASHHRRCPECRGRKQLPGMIKTTGKGTGMGSAYGPCPTCDGLGYVTDQMED